MCFNLGVHVLFGEKKLVYSRARLIYQFADIIGRYSPIVDVLVGIGIGICSLVSTDTKTCFWVERNAWTSNLKWCNHVVCPAEGGPLFNLY